MIHTALFFYGMQQNFYGYAEDAGDNSGPNGTLVGWFPVSHSAGPYYISRLLFPISIVL
jgi:hypothetical protein